jgi:homocitrate synthase
MRDAKIAVETGVDGLDVVIGTSSFLREHSHGKDMAYIEKTAIEVIEYIKSKGLEVRCELTRFPQPALVQPSSWRVAA